MVFTETFTVRDIAEPLASFDAAALSADVRDFMKSRDFDLVGIRKEFVNDQRIRGKRVKIILPRGSYQ